LKCLIGSCSEAQEKEIRARNLKLRLISIERMLDLSKTRITGEGKGSQGKNLQEHQHFISSQKE